MSADGKWNVTIATPMGNQKGVLDVQSDGAKLTGTANAMGNSVPIEDGAVNGDKMTFSLEISTPMKMKLDFDLTTSGDDIAGTVKAGMFGNLKVNGSRA
jgi:hypothetical protein